MDYKDTIFLIIKIRKYSIIINYNRLFLKENAIFFRSKRIHFSSIIIHYNCTFLRLTFRKTVTNVLEQSSSLGAVLEHEDEQDSKY